MRRGLEDTIVKETGETVVAESVGPDAVGTVSVDVVEEGRTVTKLLQRGGGEADRTLIGAVLVTSAAGLPNQFLAESQQPTSSGQRNFVLTHQLIQYWYTPQ